MVYHVRWATDCPVRTKNIFLIHHPRDWKLHSLISAPLSPLVRHRPPEQVTAPCTIDQLLRGAEGVSAVPSSHLAHCSTKSVTAPQAPRSYFSPSVHATYSYSVSTVPSSNGPCVHLTRPESPQGSPKIGWDGWMGRMGLDIATVGLHNHFCLIQ